MRLAVTYDDSYDKAVEEYHLKKVDPKLLQAASAPGSYAPTYHPKPANVFYEHRLDIGIGMLIIIGLTTIGLLLRRKTGHGV